MHRPNRQIKEGRAVRDIQTPRPAIGSTQFALAAHVAIALLVMILLGLVWAGTAGHVWNFSLAFFGKLLLTTTLPQLLFLASWAALTGALFSLGVGSGASRPRTRRFAAISGAIVPVGMVLLGGLLSRMSSEFRETTGPFDRPMLTLPLIVYGALAPWLLGRLARTLTAPAAHSAP
jgi:hypothetical protein